MTSGFNQSDKRISLAALGAMIPDGASVALGGSFLHRGPFALVRELIRQERRGLEIIKQSPGYDIDILCRAGVATRARAGIVAMEGNFGLAPWYRKAIEQGRLELEEHACASLTAGLRAAAFGVPFMPCGGLHGSDLPALNQWKLLDDPYGSGASTYLIPAVKPDFAVLQVSEIDRLGNARVHGTAHWDRIMSRAAGSVLVVAEKLVETEVFEAQPEATLLPYFMVEAFTVLPGSAWPGSCTPYYDIDYPAVERYMDTERTLQAHMAEAPELKETSHA
ncbi:MAG: CoA transferase subunit A [Achromobacter pulmonis]|uniref:3-oxoadipate CoA-transferase subunit A n=1 Tax=Achromobacter pulmonis TaxID=1389932 RepID=A0A6S7CEZ5_9BURK|nr:CoA transferase [Achromobacter pulmonis]MCF7768495.1 CoA transferase subunit A [Achromobacter pulmonis]MPT25936.1 CoA transferase subunit A [Achromobacter sp.]CAB3633651.1 3-oxoadipate CoA-transferase subunit A [Achromobacter pulmonis]CAB3846070.1 3-oxoadipate CoA-transferase subunit A [Achromobacter pulmonis]